MVDSLEAEHIQVPGELAELAGCPGSWGDGLELAAQPDRKKAGEEGSCEGLAWASCAMRGWRESMEDASLMLPKGYVGGEWRDAALFGVFDGHGGEQVARFVARRLPGALAEMGGSLRQDPERSLVGAYLRIDELLRQPAASAELRELTLPGNEVRDSAEHTGATAVCCLLEAGPTPLEGRLAVANAGDSRVVLCRQGQAVHLSEDHKPNLPRETARIEAAGSYIEEETIPGGGTGYRVNGNLNLSRALGDLHYKEPHLPPAEQTISGYPDTQSLSWKVGEDEFILLACDGVWECMSSQEAVSFVKSRLPAPGAKNKLVGVLGQLLDACCASHPKQRGGLGCDNLTAVLVRFEDPEQVAATQALGDAAEAEAAQAEDAQEGRAGRQLDAAVSQVIQRLAAGRRRKPETPAERQERLQREKEEREEAEAREKEERDRAEKRLARKKERELLESQAKKKVKFCAAAEESEDAGDEEF